MGPDPIVMGQAGAAADAARRLGGGGGPRKIHDHVARPIVVQLSAAGAHTVLDLGCGNGWFTSALERCGFDVTGVDRSEEMLDLARRDHPELRFIRRDLVAPLDASLARRFDAVVAVDVVDHLTHPRKLIEAALAALKPGGRLVLTSAYHGYAKNLAMALSGRLDRNWDALRDDSRIKFFSRTTLLALVADYAFEDVHFETIGRVSLFARAMLVSARAPL